MEHYCSTCVSVYFYLAILSALWARFEVDPTKIGSSLVAQTVKTSAYNAGDPCSIPGSARSTGEGNGNPLQYSCLEKVGYSPWCCKESDSDFSPQSGVLITVHWALPLVRVLFLYLCVILHTNVCQINPAGARFCLILKGLNIKHI